MYSWEWKIASLAEEEHPSKQRQAKEEEEKEKQEALDSISELRSEIYFLKTELDIKQLELEQFTRDQGILHDLFEKGIINENGGLL